MSSSKPAHDAAGIVGPGRNVVVVVLVAVVLVVDVVVVVVGDVKVLEVVVIVGAGAVVVVLLAVGAGSGGATVTASTGMSASPKSNRVPITPVILPDDDRQDAACCPAPPRYARLRMVLPL
jgi:hypothetical protein